MKPLIRTRTFAVALAALGALAAGTAAHARSDVFFSVGIQAPGVYVQPTQVYSHPPQVYVQPRPVYVQPAPVYVHPAPVYVQPAPVYRDAPGHRGWNHGWNHRGPYGDRDRDGIANVYDQRDGSRHGRRYGPYGDLDRDGVANRGDRDRDGDGVRNRHDRFPRDPYRY